LFQCKFKQILLTKTYLHANNRTNLYIILEIMSDLIKLALQGQ